METLLFDRKKVVKFFDILYRMSMFTNSDNSKNMYKRQNSDYVKCQREVFVERTVAKWLNGKFLILYKPVNLFGVEVIVKQYIHIGKIRTINSLSSSKTIQATIFDFGNVANEAIANPHFNISDCLNMEGAWCDNDAAHIGILTQTLDLNLKERKFVFEAFDFDKKMTKKQKMAANKSSTNEAYKTVPIAINAKTWHEMWKFKKEFSVLHKGRKYLGELIDVIDVE